jgi:hypothetical protein
MLAALVLAVPCIRWPFLWDDFDFLRRSLHLGLTDLLPDPSVTFYRPVSRELYFWFVDHLLGTSPLAAHVLNALIAAGCVFLVADLLRRSAGGRAAILGALTFSCAAALPFVVGWTSGIQDLLGIGFLLLALDLALQDRGLLVPVALAGAVLSKETATVASPALLFVLLRPEADRRASRIAMIGIGLVLVLWALIHPWARSLIGLGPNLGSNEYVAFRGRQALGSALHGILSVLNLPWDLHLTVRIGTALAALAASVVTLWSVRQANELEAAPDRRRRLDVPASLLVVAPLALTAMLIGHWSPYYGFVSVAGMALLAGPRLARLPMGAATAVLLVFLWAGILLRFSHLEPEVPAEHNLGVAAAALNRVEKGFKDLERDFPSGSHVYVLIQAGGEHGLYTSMYRYHPLRVWYHQPNLWVENPIYARRGAALEYLFWISPGLDVYEVDLETLKPRGSGTQISVPEFQKTLRGYALGLTGSGRVDRAVEVLTTMPQYSDTLAQFDRRTAAAFLISAGRPADGRRLLAGMPPFDPHQKFWSIAGLVAKPPTGMDIDVGTMIAFETDPDDPRLNRELMRWLWKSGYQESALRFAKRLNVLMPGDPEAARLLKARPAQPVHEITVPIPD